MNALTKATVGNFVSEDGTSLNLDKIINVFVNVGGKDEPLIPPYVCQASTKLKDRENATLTMQIQDWPGPPFGPGIGLNFIVTIQPGEDESSLGKITELLDWSHERIVKRFQNVFSEHAKAHFQPVKK